MHHLPRVLHLLRHLWQNYCICFRLSQLALEEHHCTPQWGTWMNHPFVSILQSVLPTVCCASERAIKFTPKKDCSQGDHLFGLQCQPVAITASLWLDFFNRQYIPLQPFAGFEEATLSTMAGLGDGKRTMWGSSSSICNVEDHFGEGITLPCDVRVTGGSDVVECSDVLV